MPKSGGANIWLPEKAIEEFTLSRYGEVSIVHDGVDSRGYFKNPRPIGAVGLNDFVDTTAVEEYFATRKRTKITLTIPQNTWGDLKDEKVEIKEVFEEAEVLEEEEILEEAEVFEDEPTTE